MVDPVKQKYYTQLLKLNVSLLLKMLIGSIICRK